MAEWCRNRFEITGKSVCLDVLTQWIEGGDVPRYRHAIQQSILLFLAGCAGILKPVRTVTYPPYPGLVSHGAGSGSTASQAFEQWLGLLTRDAFLNHETVKTIDRLYHQTGIGAVRWGNLPDSAREIIGGVLAQQYTDWFGTGDMYEPSEHALLWDELSAFAESSQPCDMLQVMPTRLATELNGSGGLLKNCGTTRSFYCRQFGVECPVGQNVRWKRTGLSTLILEFDSTWCPPSGSLVGEISAVFDCEVRHWYSEPKNGIRGYDCYDGGEHTDSNMEAEWPHSDDEGEVAEHEQPQLCLIRDTQPGERAMASASVGAPGPVVKIV
ncbi:DUF1281 domain-containing protein [Escherichia coli]|uniref:DUF1281 domain-containing protein n=1 Tax=Escherichia coli TaxID=562 RepID=UPI0007A0BF3B|nr:DUF1281 domain-containing protein [Escherichia coli]EFN6376865.1 DUF1281 domain-containing protein [Escherichia coli]EHH6062288.1 DUF1281 domain-containing protein [Escherichia coli]EII7519538.1 DUF1281 domain-containing protein [Escherichia coli]KYV48681.1 hypothetical protein AMK78_18860 [Escherichia coli]QRT17068.1 DUF1281 domain-containing protein [Escherichia coli]